MRAVQAVDYYQLLGVNRQASRETLRQAFRLRMLDLHPDLHPNDSLACVRTRELVEAYHVLSDPKARKSYDESLARADVPDLDWHYAEQDDAVTWTRQAPLLIAAALALIILCMVIRSCLDQRVPVFRFQLTELWTDRQHQSAALLVEPDIQHSLEWYQTMEYQFCSASAMVTQETAAIYAKAVESAERIGDHNSAEFYKLSLQEIQRAQAADTPLGPAAPESGTNSSVSRPSSGAKRAVESS